MWVSAPRVKNNDNESTAKCPLTATPAIGQRTCRKSAPFLADCERTEPSPCCGTIPVPSTGARWSATSPSLPLDCKCILREDPGSQLPTSGRHTRPCLNIMAITSHHFRSQTTGYTVDASTDRVWLKPTNSTNSQSNSNDKRAHKSSVEIDFFIGFYAENIRDKMVQIHSQNGQYTLSQKKMYHKSTRSPSLYWELESQWEICGTIPVPNTRARWSAIKLSPHRIDHVWWSADPVRSQ